MYLPITIIKRNRAVGEYCTIDYSSITLSIFNSKLKPATGWHDSRKTKTAKMLAKIFCFDLGTSQTLSHLEDAVRQLTFMQNELHMTPTMIRDHFKLEYSNFSMFMQNIGIKLNSVAVGLQKYNNSYKKDIENYKIYHSHAGFKFPHSVIHRISGNHLLTEFGVFNVVTNPNGLVRDHMVSRRFGFDNGIPVDVINHPANCRFISSNENCKKGMMNSITISELYDRIEKWNSGSEFINIIFENIKNTKKIRSVSDEQKTHLAKMNTGMKNYTDGKVILRQHKDLPIPTGYYPGMKPRTGKNKKRTFK